MDGQNPFRNYRKYVTLDTARKLNRLGWDLYTDYQYWKGDFVQLGIEECALAELSGDEVIYIPDITQAVMYLQEKYPDYFIQIQRSKDMKYIPTVGDYVGKPYSTQWEALGDAINYVLDKHEKGISSNFSS